MKAFSCFPGDSPSDAGCILVYAETASKARCLALWDWPGDDVEFVDFKARRVPSLDEHHAHVCPSLSACVVEDNAELPCGVTFYSELDF